MSRYFFADPATLRPFRSPYLAGDYREFYTDDGHARDSRIPLSWRGKKLKVRCA